MVQAQQRQKLRAEDVEDLAIVAALMQDAVTRIGDMAYDPDERTFMMAGSRFRHEQNANESEGSRIASALIFGCVKSVQHRGIETQDPQKNLTLMTIATEPGTNTLYRIALLFEGGGEIRLTSDCLHCRMEDFGDITSCERPQNRFMAEDI